MLRELWDWRMAQIQLGSWCLVIARSAQLANLPAMGEDCIASSGCSGMKARDSLKSKATDADHSAPEAVSQACMKQASDKQLTGDDKTQFVDKCKKGKTTRQDH
jgi:hypothetical protein